MCDSLTCVSAVMHVAHWHGPQLWSGLRLSWFPPASAQFQEAWSDPGLTLWHLNKWKINRVTSIVIATEDMHTGNVQISLCNYTLSSLVGTQCPIKAEIMKKRKQQTISLVFQLFCYLIQFLLETHYKPSRDIFEIIRKGSIVPRYIVLYTTLFLLCH